MQNRYQVKIDESILPELYSFDQLINAGLLDDYDENIKIRLVGDTAWITARSYPFAGIEKQTDKYRQDYKDNPREEPSKSFSLEYPSNIDKWNWGAFCLSWIWSICNGIYWPLIIIVFNFIPYIGILVSFCICLFLGKRGNEIAWCVARREGTSTDSFALTQSKWNKAGIIIMTIILFCALLLMFISIIIR